MTFDLRRDVLPGVRNGLVAGVCVLAVALPTHRWWLHHRAVTTPPSATQVAQAPVRQVAPRVLDWGSAEPSESARRLAAWIVSSADNGDRPFAVIDKPAARLYVFEPGGRLRGETPVLLGSYKSDDTLPGVGGKPLAQLKPEERTTPAGRFITEPGRNLVPENVVWIDYDAALSMHPVLLAYKQEHRQERLDSPTIADNRISNGCVNVPTAFFHDTVWPLMGQGKAVVYLVPEIKSLEEVFPGVAAVRAEAGTPDVSRHAAI